MIQHTRYEAYRSVAGLSPAAEALLAYVRDRDYVTYAEMPGVLAPLIPIKGPMVVEAPSVPNLIFWAGMSEEWVETLNELFAAGLLWREPCSLWCYLIDGGMLRMPLAKRPPTQGYATPHWAPTCVRPIEHIAPRERKKYASTMAKEASRGETPGPMLAASAPAV